MKKIHPAFDKFDFQSARQLAQYGFIIVTIALIIGLIASLIYAYVAGFDLKTSNFPSLIKTFLIMTSGMVLLLFLIGGMAPKED